MPDAFEDMGLLPLAQHAGALPGFEHAPVDLSRCDVLLISCGLTSKEQALGLSIAEWPAGVRVRITSQMLGWIKANPTRNILLLSSGFADGVCFVMLHHAPTETGEPQA